MSEKSKSGEVNQNSAENTISRIEWFIESHQKKIIAALLILILSVGGFWSYRHFYVTPRTEEAQRLVFFAQNHFANDQFRIALDGDGINPGFLEIIDDFGSTPVGRLSKYYAGISHLHLGEYREAIANLEGFRTRDKKLRAVAQGAIGDAYLELGSKTDAVEWYTKATSVKNDITTPFFLLKKGMVLESMGNNEDALDAYKLIRDEFPNSTEARDIEKYIVRASI